MKNIFKIAGFMAIIIIAASCQMSNRGKILSNETLRKEIIDSIANDPAMCMDMMNAMMSSEHCKMMMMEDQNMMKMMMGNQKTMQQMMKDNPEMMGDMMNTMMNACEGDSSKMMGMCKKMMDNPQMKGMMCNMTMKQSGKKMMHNKK